MWSWVAVVLLWFGPAAAWYLPGMAPTDYNQDDEIPVLVNRLTSSGDSSSNSLMGYDYYHSHFRFCQPSEGKESRGGSLGAILFGDRIYTSPIKLKMLKEEKCRYICKTSYRPRDAEFVASRIVQGFEQHWLVDGLPVGGRNADDEYVSTTGFPLGEVMDVDSETDDQVRLFNHFEITIDYHLNQAEQKYRIVGASVKPSSRRTPLEEDGFNCKTTEKGIEMSSDTVKDQDVSFSYSVNWEPSDTPWATRWDKYLQVTEPRINWFALINTTVLVFFLALFCALTLMRMLRKDIAKYNEVDLGSDDIPDEMGWKMVAGDVYRAPAHTQAYSLAIGSGMQVLVTIFCTLTLAVLGFLSPANRGSFSTVLLLLNTLFGGVGGYASATVYKTWGGTSWKSNLLLTPLVVPAIVFGLFVCVNFLLVFSEASGAVPFGSMAALLAIWGLISVPLSLVCGFIAFKRAVPYPPNMRVNQIPRQIPPQAWHHRMWAMMLIGGFIPFLAVSLQLRYIMNAIWFQRIYYMFGFLFASISAMVLLSALTSLLALYFALVAEDYRWQWRTFCVAGSPGIYIFLYACYYLARSMAITYWTGRLLYLGYSLLACMLCFLALGSVGSVTAYLLVRRIYESIKID